MSALVNVRFLGEKLMVFVLISLFKESHFIFAEYDSLYENMYELPHSLNDDRCSSITKEISVQTNFGKVIGRAVTLCDEPGLPLPHRPGEGGKSVRKTIRVFLGIPYAHPPIGSLKFQPPKPKKIDEGEIKALYLKPSCPQNAKYLGYRKGINNTDENCLYLNIYAPEMSESVTHSGFPVMIYIHGGNWDHGSANLFPAHMLTTQEVVVVTFNYRLGHLGFLSTGNSASVGNYGILDQSLALKWIYDYISHFGGDPMSITLFGFDAGAVSASLLSISSHSRNMVKRVIAQNGAPLSDWGMIIDRDFAVNTSRRLGEALGCTTEDSAKLVGCLNTRTNNEYRYLDVKPLIGWLPWGPVVDNFTQIRNKILFPKSPEDLLTDGIPFKSDFAVLTGTSRDEGVNILLADQLLLKQNYRFSVSVLKQKITDLLSMYNYSVNSQSILDAVMFMYMPGLDLYNETLLRQAYIDLLSDRYYKAPNYRFAKYLIQNGVKTYLYVCNYTFEGYHFPHSWQGVSSETEYLLLTGAPFMNPKYYPSSLNLIAARWTKADRDMSHFYLKAWTDFAKYGNPTKSSFLNTILWEPAAEDNLLFLNLNTTNTTIQMIKDYRKTESDFWNCYAPFLINHISPTLSPTLDPGVEELRLITAALYGTIAACLLFATTAIMLCILYWKANRYESY